MNKSEILFSSYLDEQGKTWFFEPKVFNFPMGQVIYCPDFYVVEENKFYEVIGSRQAYYANKHKYELFKKHYGDKFDFEVVTPSGENYHTHYYDMEEYIDNTVYISSVIKKILDRPNLTGRQKAVVNAIIVNGLNMSEASRACGMLPGSLHKFFNRGYRKDPQWIDVFFEKFICKVDRISSKVCSYGIKGCVLDHKEEDLVINTKNIVEK